MGYDFGAEMQNIQNTETTGQYITEPGIYDVTIKSYKIVSPEKGTPYLEIVFETDDKLASTNRFYLVKQGDSENSAQFKRERIKRLMDNAEVPEGLTGEEPIKAMIGKKVQVLFKNEEYIGYDKDNNNKPEIRTKIVYSFSEKVGKTINGNESYLRSALKEAESKRFDGELMQWNRDYGQAEPQATAPSPTPEQSAPPTQQTPPPPISDDEPF